MFDCVYSGDTLRRQSIWVSLWTVVFVDHGGHLIFWFGLVR